MSSVRILRMRLLRARVADLERMMVADLWREEERDSQGRFVAGSGEAKLFAEKLRALKGEFAIHEQPTIDKSFAKLMAQAEKHAAGESVAKVSTPKSGSTAKTGGGRRTSAKPVPSLKPSPLDTVRPLRPVALSELDPYKPLDPYQLLDIYGPDQLTQMLPVYGLATLRDMAKAVSARNPGAAKPNLNKPESMIKYILDGVSSKLQPAPAQAPSTAKTATSRRTYSQPLTPIARITDHTIDPNAPPDPVFLSRLYGHAALGQALDDFDLKSLKLTAAQVQKQNPGTKPATKTQRYDLIDYIVAHTPQP